MSLSAVRWGAEARATRWVPTLPLVGRVDARSASGWGDSSRSSFTPPRLAASLLADPPPPGEGIRACGSHRAYLPFDCQTANAPRARLAGGGCPSSVFRSLEKLRGRRAPTGAGAEAPHP